MKKRVLLLAMALMVSTTAANSAGAWTEQELLEDQAWTSMQLDATYNYIDQLWAQREALQEQIYTVDANLTNIMVSIEVLKSDIAKKEEEIEKTEKNLTKAENAEKEQFESMKARFKYLYENGGDDAWLTMLLNADDLSELLTRAEYTQKMYEQDRKSLEVYANTIKEVETLNETYLSEQAELEEMKAEMEQQSQELAYQLEVLQANDADCANEIAWAQQQATEYANLLVEQQILLDQLEAERIAAEEAAAAAAAQEAEEAAAYYDETEVVTDEDGNVVSYSDTDSSTEVEYDEYGNVIDTGNTVTDYESGSSGSGSGSSVVDFATQYVGNPYVWGGTSLTNGADCSGFVQSVYSNFGVSLPRTSYEQQNAGREVSYADAQAGDLICYGGHVAIYMGDGKIVHASNSRDGIKISNDATYRPILSVRRLVD